MSGSSLLGEELRRAADEANKKKSYGFTPPESLIRTLRSAAASGAYQMDTKLEIPYGQRNNFYNWVVSEHMSVQSSGGSIWTFMWR